jgi:hypothetical protein
MKFGFAQWSAAACLAIASACTMAQPAKAPAADFKPEVGQEGKDVVWVPTMQGLVNKMLDMAKLTPKDIHYDLGSGDGRTVITAAKRGVRSFGIEYNPDMVTLSQRNAQKEGVADKATFIKADLFETDFSQATVLTLFLLPSINEKLRPKILDMKPGTRVVSNSFPMGDWEADETAEVAGSGDGSSSYYRKALLWIVPAKVDGKWKSEAGDLTLKQIYQKFTGSINVNGVSTLIANGRLAGDKITFSAGGMQYSGVVNGNAISGTVTSGAAPRPWNASR